MRLQTLLALLSFLLLGSGCSTDEPAEDDDDDVADDDGGDDDGGDDDTTPTEGDHAEIVSHTLPATAGCGDLVSATVTVRNAGTTTWSRDEDYKLGAVDDDDPLHPDDVRIELPEGVTVEPGETHEFALELTIPGGEGSYLTDWQMVQEFVHWFGDVAAEDVEVGCAMGPLVVSPGNPRYFEDPAGDAVLLVGSHTWDNRQDWGGSFPDFQWGAYLDLLQDHNHNFIRLWVIEGTTNGGTDPQELTPPIWERDPSGTYDLDVLDDAFFLRTRERVEDARDRGVYVGVMLFQGWSIRHIAFGYEPWPTHPFNPANNTNGVNGDLDGDGQGEEVHTLQSAAITALQDAYVTRMVEELNDLDNVLWEIANETHAESVDWQAHMISLIHDIEATLPNQHPVGMTFALQASNNALLGSDAEWISPSDQVDPEDWSGDPPAGTGAKVILVDNDHVTDVLGSTSPNTYRDWVWKSFTRGHNVILMDAIWNPWPGLEWHDACDPNNPGLIAARDYLGDLRTIADSVDLLTVVPDSARTSTGFCLADPGATVIVYQPEGGSSFSVDLEAGTWDYEWFNANSGAYGDTGSVTSGGGAEVFEPPFNGDAVLVLRGS